MWMTEPSVQIIADSINPQTKDRLTTFQLSYWRPILPEMNTHRIFSRNAASSRAQSFKKRLTQVCVDPAVPAHWNAEKPGMVGGEEFSKEIKQFINGKICSLAQMNAEFLEKLNKEVYQATGYEIHKQYLNRYLEPFTQVTQLVSSTDWNNFFKLRLAEDAQPEIKDVAMAMFTALDTSTPEVTDLHLPYISLDEREEFNRELLIKLAVARCARVSYAAYVQGSVDLEKDLRLYSRLQENGHLSPFEHIAVPAVGSYFNLTGWKSYRYAIETHSDF